MNTRAIWHFVPCMLAAIALIAMTQAASAGSFTRLCAARDLQLLMIIEDRESAGALSEEKLSDIMFKLMNARIVCHEGRAQEALAIYDSIAEQMFRLAFDGARFKEIR